MPLYLSGDSPKISADSTGVITSATSVSSVSVTSVSFTGIPNWAKRITVMLSGVSSNGTSAFLLRVGSGSISSSGYSSGQSAVSTSVGIATATSGFLIGSSITATDTFTGTVILTTLDGAIWVSSGVLANVATGSTRVSGGNITLSGALDRVQITTVNGTDLFDTGTINILYE